MRNENQLNRLRISGAALLLSLALLALTSVLCVQAQAASTPPASSPQQPNATLLALYVLAFDNNREANELVNLTYKYTATVTSLVNATHGFEDVTAVILADLDDYGDTHILVAQNGSVTPIAGLPDSSGILDPSLTEYDVTAGVTLGGFLLWARQEYPATKTILSYIGHGGPLAPYSEPAIAAIITAAATVRSTNVAIPMPLDVDVNPNFTDQHAPGVAGARLLTPYDLAFALDVGTNGGADKIDVLDLLHCFAASIEQLTEVAPYAVTTIAAPNYAFFDPPMVGTALADLEPDMTPVEMANRITTSYATVIPPNNHPNVLVAVDNDKIPVVKEKWDEVAAGLMNSFADNPEETAVALLNVYAATANTASLYDTTFCGEVSDYQLNPPDALADMGGFALSLAQQFITLSPDVALKAIAAQQAINNAVTLKINQNGLPWWDSQPEWWNFNGVSGIALFTPFVPMELAGVFYHPWQALWYTNTHTIAENVVIGGAAVDVLNPHPYQFITPGSSAATWANVIDAYWTQRSLHPFETTPTLFCLPETKEIEDADLFITLADSADPVYAGWPMEYEVRIVNKTTIAMPDVTLTVTLPLHTYLLSVTPTANCQQRQDTVICQPGDFAGHEETAVTIRVLLSNQPGEITLHAVAASTRPETRWQNNQSTERTEALPAAFLYIPISLNP